jgi:hypothetical protein
MRDRRLISYIEGMERERYMSKVHTKGKSKSMNMYGEFVLIIFIRRDGWNALRKRPISGPLVPIGSLTALVPMFFPYITYHCPQSTVRFEAAGPLKHWYLRTRLHGVTAQGTDSN